VPRRRLQEGRKLQEDDDMGGAAIGDHVTAKAMTCGQVECITVRVGNNDARMDPSSDVHDENSTNALPSSWMLNCLHPVSASVFSPIEMRVTNLGKRKCTRLKRASRREVRLRCPNRGEVGLR
jgi:hypothetical protein